MSYIWNKTGMETYSNKQSNPGWFLWIYTRPLKNWDIVSEEFQRGECSRQMGTMVVESLMYLRSREIHVT